MDLTFPSPSATATPVSPVRPVFQQFVAIGPPRSLRISSSLARTASLNTHNISPLQDSLWPNDISLLTITSQPISSSPSLLVKRHRGTGSLLAPALKPLNISSTYRPTPTISTPPSSGMLPSPVFAALSEVEETRSGYPRPELQGAAMEDAVNRTRALWIDPRHIHPDEKQAHAWGAFGEVQCCWLTGRTERFALKVIKLKEGRSKRRLLRHLLREVMVWHKLDHHNVTPFVGYTFDGDSAGILSIWQEEGNLKEYLERNPDKFLSLSYQVASGLAYLHSRNPQIVHGDLKPENVVVGADGVARLVDFGLSTILDPLFHGLRSSDGCRNTLLYADPVLLNNTYRTIYTDLWALGWLIYELATSRHPYDHCKTYAAVVGSIITYKLPTRGTHVIPHHPELIWPILDACWSRDLSCRWSAEKVASRLMQALSGFGVSGSD